MMTGIQPAEPDGVTARHGGDAAVGRSRLWMPVALLLSAGWGALLCYSAMYLTGETRVDDSQRQPVEFPAGFAPVLKEVPADIMRVRAARRLAEPDAEPDAQPAATQETLLPTQPAAPAPTVVADASAAPLPVPKRTELHEDYYGTWGPNPAACGTAARRRGYLPAVIGPNGARAGDTRCSFRDVDREGPSWVMTATCNDKARRWSSQVRLTVNGERLTWSSGKGTSSYVRCARREG